MASFLHSCRPLPCLGNLSEHWQPPVNSPPLSVHNLFCSLVLKRESRNQEFVWGFQYSILGSRKIEFITWVNRSSEYSLLGSEHNCSVKVLLTLPPVALPNAGFFQVATKSFEITRKFAIRRYQTCFVSFWGKLTIF